MWLFNQKVLYLQSNRLNKLTLNDNVKCRLNFSGEVQPIVVLVIDFLSFKHQFQEKYVSL